MDIKDGPTARESDVFEEGMEYPVPFQTPVGRVGPMICFDVSLPARGACGGDMIRDLTNARYCSFDIQKPLWLIKDRELRSSHTPRLSPSRLAKSIGRFC